MHGRRHSIRPLAMVLLGAAVCVVPVLRAQEQTLPPAASAAPAPVLSPNLAGIAHVALRVSDLPGSVAFYTRLGFAEAFVLRDQDGAVRESFIKINDRQFLELYPRTTPDAQVGFLHLCFEGRDLQSVHDYYVAHGLTPTAVKTAGAGNLLFTMAGPLTPTGPQNMEYTQYMPGSLHSKDFGQHLGADRISRRLISVTLAVDDPEEARAFYLDRVGFNAEPGSKMLVIPGADGAAVEIVPTGPLGFKAWITFEADLNEAAASLSKRAAIFVKTARYLALEDPDGNRILLVK